MSPILNRLLSFLKSLIPGRRDVSKSARILGMAIIGGVLLSPLTARLPVLDWDWYFFFTAHHPTGNIYSPDSPFFPYTRYVIELLTWLPWRT
ncbi:MAG: hypothetical protein PHQ40_02920 [Anaerolineaceae bacterium]|nr:hypothetical protein [Anaerolineaceae bacterium]